MELKKFKQEIRKIASELLYQVKEQEDRLLLGRESTLLTIPFDFYEEKVTFYLFARTTSWDAPGERTDLNDILSTLPAIFLRIESPHISSTLFDIENPCGIAPEIEVYARYIAFTQPNNYSLLDRSTETLSIIRNILETLTVYESNLHHFMEFDLSIEQDSSFKDKKLRQWASFISNALSEDLDAENITFNKRINPHWFYYRSQISKMSIYLAPVTSKSMTNLLSHLTPWEKYEDADFFFFKSKYTQNAATRYDVNTIVNLLQTLENNETNVNLIPIENRLIALSKNYIIFKESECDRQAYVNGRKHIIKRRKQEQNFLFEGNVYVWSDSIDGGRFEGLIRDLLSKRNDILQVRNTSVTNEPDANADLICIWYTTSLSDMPQHEDIPPVQKKKIVVQCKAWAKNIGKNDLPSIRDTLDRFDADGMLVATSKTVSRSLFEHFEVLRKKGIWVDYWNRASIEDMLDNHPELIEKYSDIISYANEN